MSGSHPGGGTVSTSQTNLTIEGNSSVQVGALTINASGVTLNSLLLSTVTINDAGSETITQNTIATGGSITATSTSISGTTNGGTNVQTITLNSPVAGQTQFNLSFNGATTGAITYTGVTNTDVNAVQNALNHLSTILNVGGSVTVAEPSPGVFTVTFGGSLAGSAQPQITGTITTAGHDTFSQNTFKGSAYLNLQGGTGSTITSNTFSSSTAAVAIETVDASGSITSNTLSLTGGIGIEITDSNGAGTSITANSNTVSTTSGIGIETNHTTSGSFVVSLASNILTNNLVGLYVVGNGQGAVTDYGNITAGGTSGSNSSTGNNDLAGYTGASGSYAIKSNDGGNAPSGTTILAEFNSFGGISPATVVKTIPSDGTTINATGFATPVDVVASSVTAYYSSNSQNVTLNATVTDPQNASDIVKEGSVTFTVKNGSTVIGSPVTVPVSSGDRLDFFQLAPCVRARRLYHRRLLQRQRRPVQLYRLQQHHGNADGQSSRRHHHRSQYDLRLQHGRVSDGDAQRHGDGRQPSGRHGQ